MGAGSAPPLGPPSEKATSRGPLDCCLRRSPASAHPADERVVLAAVLRGPYAYTALSSWALPTGPLPDHPEPQAVAAVPVEAAPLRPPHVLLRLLVLHCRRHHHPGLHRHSLPHHLDRCAAPVNSDMASLTIWIGVAARLCTDMALHGTQPFPSSPFGSVCCLLYSNMELHGLTAHSLDRQRHRLGIAVPLIWRHHMQCT